MRYTGRRKPALWALLGLLLAGLAVFAGLELYILTGAGDRPGEDADVVVILGAKVDPDGPSMLLRDRLDKALDYLAEHPDTPVVVSGGQGADEPMSEAQCMYDYLTARGVPAELVWREDRSTSTLENLRYTGELLKERGYDLAVTHLVVVSNGFHLRRVELLAGRLGLDAGVLAAPASHLPARLKSCAREPLALIKSLVFDH